MEFLGYKNNQVTLNYDNDGFLVVDSTEYIIFKSPHNERNMYSISISFCDKTPNYYQYHMSVIAETNYGNSVAYGNIKIYYDSVNKRIKSIVVNDMENGNLCDKYDDCFDISVSSYIKILYNGYIKFDSFFDEKNCNGV